MCRCGRVPVQNCMQLRFQMQKISSIISYGEALCEIYKICTNPKCPAYMVHLLAGQPIAWCITNHETVQVAELFLSQMKLRAPGTKLTVLMTDDGVYVCECVCMCLCVETGCACMYDAPYANYILR